MSHVSLAPVCVPPPLFLPCSLLLTRACSTPRCATTRGGCCTTRALRARAESRWGLPSCWRSMMSGGSLGDAEFLDERLVLPAGVPVGEARLHLHQARDQGKHVIKVGEGWQRRGSPPCRMTRNSSSSELATSFNDGVAPRSPRFPPPIQPQRIPMPPPYKDGWILEFDAPLNEKRHNLNVLYLTQLKKVGGRGEALSITHCSFFSCVHQTCNAQTCLVV